MSRIEIPTKIYFWKIYFPYYFIPDRICQLWLTGFVFSFIWDRFFCPKIFHNFKNIFSKKNFLAFFFKPNYVHIRHTKYAKIGVWQKVLKCSYFYDFKKCYLTKYWKHWLTVWLKTFGKSVSEKFIWDWKSKSTKSYEVDLKYKMMKLHTFGISKIWIRRSFWWQQNFESE